MNKRIFVCGTRAVYETVKGYEVRGATSGNVVARYGKGEKRLAVSYASRNSFHVSPTDR